MEIEQINYASHTDQRVAVFIDTQNLYHSAKSNYRSNVSYHELMKRAVNGRKLIRAFAYVIKSEESTEEKFFDAIEEIGIEIRVKDLQVFHTGAKKADWDVGIAVDMIRLTEKVDVVVLASGDGDFIEVVRYCKSRGVRVEIMAFEKTTNAAIMEECDNFVDLGDPNSNFLISGRRRNTADRKSYGGGYGARAVSDNFEQAGYDQPVSEPVVKRRESENSVSNGLSMTEIIKPYGGNNLSTVNRQVNKSSSIDPKIYGKNVQRKIKPVVGLPAKPVPSIFARKNFVNDETTAQKHIENAFGNNLPKKKKYF